MEGLGGVEEYGKEEKGRVEGWEWGSREWTRGNGSGREKRGRASWTGPAYRLYKQVSI